MNLNEECIKVMSKECFSCLGGRMETKIKLNVGTLTDLNDISSIVITTMSYEYFVDILRTAIRKYDKDNQLKPFIDDFAKIIDTSYDVSFSSVGAWQQDYALINSKMFELVKGLDSALAEKEILAEGEFGAEIQNQLIQFITKLSTLKITNEELDVTGLDLPKEYLISALEQLTLLDEGMLISQLASMELDFTPVDSKRDRNKFIEEKLNRLDKLTKSCQKTFDSDYDKLLDQILAMYDKFYNISYSTDTDGEKIEKARKVVKVINSHRQLLDKLENKLAEANELKRQLLIHKKKVNENLVEQTQQISDKINENPEAKEILDNQLRVKEFVAFEYGERIAQEIDALTSLQEKMTAHYKVLDQLDISLKTAIPNEENLSKFSSIVHKFQELSVRLELNKSQPEKPSKEVLQTLNTAVMGLRMASKFADDFKELYLRNSMLTAIFRAINDLNDFATSENKAEQLNQINYITAKLGKYDELEKTFSQTGVNYRKMANDVIRNISIVISKTINCTNLFEVIDMIDALAKQFETLYDELQNNHKQQVEIMKEIITL